jgi:hypothetical protein
MKIEFNGQYTRGEFFQAVALINGPSRRSMIIRICALVILVALYIAYFIFAVPEAGQSTFELVRVGRHVITIGIILYLLLLPYLSAYRTASRLWNIPSVQEAFHGFVSSQGVIHGFSSDGQIINWDQFAKVRMTDKFIALLTSDGILSLLPRSFFKSEAEWNTVRQWAGHRVAEAV